MADSLLTGQQEIQRLEHEYPGPYIGSLRTLERRIGD